MDMSADLLSSLGFWWQRRLAGADCPAGALLLESMDNPGWSLRLDQPPEMGVEGTTFRPFRRSDHDWLEVQITSDHLTLVSGPLNLSEMVYQFLSYVGGKELLALPAPEVPHYYHGFGMPELFDLCIRISKWFISHCDYDWEHGFGFTLAGDWGGWTLSAETRTYEGLTEVDLLVLNRPPETDLIRFWKDGRELKSSCAPADFAEMVARNLEWLEEDWKRYPPE